MTIDDYPEYLALGYLLNQHMLLPDDVVTGVDYDEELAVVVVRTKRKTNYEKKLKKKVQTSGCAQGTVFGDLMEALEDVTLPEAELRTSWLYALTHKINTTPSLYLEAGAIHGCVLAQRGPAAGLHGGRRPPQRRRQDRRLDVQASASRAHDKIFYTTGRLTSEMVIKTVRMGIPILISRSGFTAWGVELARKANLTLIGRARGKRFVALAGEEPHRVRPGPALRRGGERQAPAQGGGRMSEPRLSAPLGLVLAGGLARRMGGGDKARIRDRRQDHPRARAGAAHAAMRAAHPQRQRRSRALRRHRPAGRADSVPDFAGPLAGILAGLDWAAAHAPDIADVASVPGDCPFLPADLVARLRRRARAAGTAARLRALGRVAPSGGRAVAGRAARRPAPGAGRGGPAQDRDLDRAPRRRHRRLAGHAGRSVLQRQHAGGSRAERARARLRGAGARRYASMRPGLRLIAAHRTAVIERAIVVLNDIQERSPCVLYLVACICRDVVHRRSARSVVARNPPSQKPVETAFASRQRACGCSAHQLASAA